MYSPDLSKHYTKEAYGGAEEIHDFYTPVTGGSDQLHAPTTLPPVPIK